jgi:hypothetical protein
MTSSQMFNFQIDVSSTNINRSELSKRAFYN